MRIHKTVMSALTVGLAIFTISLPASATNPGTVPGDHTSQCQVQWRASSVLDTDLSHDDPNYPGLMQDLSGQDVGYSNGGYIQAVEPKLGNAGYLEMNHFYLPGYGTQVWRIPTATDYPMKNVAVTFELGEGYTDPSDYEISFNPISTNSSMDQWGGDYARYTWAARTGDIATKNEDGSWTINLGDFHASTGTVYQFEIKNADGSLFPHTAQFIAHATLEGEYIQGAGCDVPTIPNPEPTPEIGVCEVELLGTTIWNRTDTDITERIKAQNGEFEDLVGEVNADGWGADSDSWEQGATRHVRLYGGSQIELINVTYSAVAVQGFTFAPDTISELVTPGEGALVSSSGLDQTVQGAEEVVMDATGTVQVPIDRMPANSSFSFNIIGILDDTTSPIVIHHRLIGEDPECDDPYPGPTTTPPPAHTPEPGESTSPDPSPEPTATTPSSPEIAPGESEPPATEASHALTPSTGGYTDSGAGESLPSTGSSITLLLILGIGMVLVGGAALRRKPIIHVN